MIAVILVGVGMVKELMGRFGLLMLLSTVALAATQPVDDPRSDWAYWEVQALKKALPETGLTVPGSKLTLTREARDKLLAAPDWFPAEHPAMPVAVGEGRAACNTCHGPQLQGAGNIPPLAGQRPTYRYRQLYDMQHGYRRGPQVATLTAQDRIAIAAYLTSLKHDQ